MLGSFLLASLCMGCMNPKSCLRDDNTYWMLSDSVIYKQLGPSLTDIFFSSDCVKCYHITYKDSIDNNSDTQVIENYVRDSLITTLSKSQSSVLQFVLLSNTCNYFDDTIKVQSPYIPCLEFEFVKKDNKPASLLVSLSDHSWKIVQDRQVHLSHNYTDMKSVERFCKYFMDKYYSKKGEVK